MTPSRFIPILVGWIVVFLFLLSDVGEPMCEDGPKLVTLGLAAGGLLMLLLPFIIGYGLAKAHAEDDHMNELIEHERQSSRRR